jgi:hypothetical protein
MTSIFGSGLRIPPQVKRKVFVSYHHLGDQAYYDAFSRTFHDNYDVITDNSLERRIDSDDADYIRRRISENNITGTSCTIVLVGAKTWGRKHVDWEIKTTLDMQHALIGVRLPTAVTSPQGTVVVPGRLHDNIQSGYALWPTWAEVTSSAEACTGYIEIANQRGKKLIVNARERLLKNY